MNYNPGEISIILIFAISVYAAGILTRSIKLTFIPGAIITALCGWHFLRIYDYNLFTQLTSVSNFPQLLRDASISLIALFTGLIFSPSKIKEIRFKVYKQIFVHFLLLFSVVLIFLILIYFNVHNIQYLINSNTIGLLLLFILFVFSTSSETLLLIEPGSVNNDTKSLIRQSAILKEFFGLVILLSSFYFLTGYNEVQSQNFFAFSIIWKVLLSGIIAGISILLAFSVSKKYSIFFIILITSSYSIFLSHNNISVFPVFLIAGLIFSAFKSEITIFEKNYKVITPFVFGILYGLFFLDVKIEFSQNAIIVASILLTLKILLLYSAYKINPSLFIEGDSKNKFSWTGLISFSGLAFIFLLNGEFSNLVATPILSGFNLAIVLSLISGSVLYFIFGNEIEKEKIVVEEKPEELILPEENESQFQKTHFQNPAFNKTTDKLFYDLLFDLDMLHRNFESKFFDEIQQDSAGLIAEVINIYTRKFEEAGSIIIDPAFTPIQIKSELNRIKNDLSTYFIQFLDERKIRERKFDEFEDIVNTLLDKVFQLTSKLPDTYIYYVKKVDKTFYGKGIIPKFKHLYYRLLTDIATRINKDYRLKLPTALRSISRTYLIGRFTKELFETINLTGSERLNMLKKIRTFHKNVLEYIDSLILKIVSEKNSLAVSAILYAEYEENREMLLNEIKIYESELEIAVNELKVRLHYSFATPYNEFLDCYSKVVNYDIDQESVMFSKNPAVNRIGREKTLEAVRNWVTYFTGYIGFLQKEIYLQNLEVKLNIFLDQELLSLLDTFSTKIRNTCSSLFNELEILNSEIKECETSGKGDLLSLLSNLRLRKNFPSLEKGIFETERILKGRNISVFFQNILKTFKFISDAYPDTCVLIPEKDLVFKNRAPVFIEPFTVKFKSVAQYHLRTDFPKEISEINEYLLNILTKIIIDFRELTKVISYHCDTIRQQLELDNRNLSVSLSLIQELSEIIKLKIDEVNQKTEELETGIYSKVVEKTRQATIQINEKVIESTSKSHRFSSDIMVSLNVEYNLRKIRVISAKLLQDSKYYFLLFNQKIISPVLKKIKQNYYYLIGSNKSTGTTDLFSIEDKIKNLPFIYSKLFDGVPLEFGELFIGKEKIELEILKLRELFNTKRPSSLLITGEPGAGKTSTINMIETQILKNQDLISLNFEERICDEEALLKFLSIKLGYKSILTRNEVVSVLNERYKGYFITVKNFQKLFQRKVGGYQALRTLIYIISLTQSSVIWICVIQKISFLFLNKNFNVASYFSKHINLEEINTQIMREIIISRHKTTGFSLKYLDDGLNQFKNSLFNRGNLKDKQAFLSDQFFLGLNKFAGGNIVSAMNFWLNSISHVNKAEIFIDTYRELPFVDLSYFELKHILVLYTILLHGGISKVQIAESMNMKEDETAEILSSLNNNNLLRMGDSFANQDYYYINKFRFRSIENELKRRNLI